VVVKALAAGLDCDILEPDFKGDFLAVDLSLAGGGGTCVEVGAMVVADVAGVAIAATAREELGGKAGVIV